MSQAPSASSLPRLSLVTLGQEGHGKTTLLAALTRVLAKTGGARALTYDDLHPPPEERDGFARLAHVEYQTPSRRYVHVDCPGHDDFVKGLLSGELQAEGALLVVSAAAGPTPQTREQLRLAHHGADEHAERRQFLDGDALSHPERLGDAHPHPHGRAAS